jgi:Kef-type K+ transport system membrane component KefB
MRIIPKEMESLWTLFTAPVVWALHFLICYIGAAVYCAKSSQISFGFGAVRVGVVIVTITALALITMSAFLAWRQWGFGTYDPPHDDPTRHDRKLFQGFATLLLSGLSFIAVIYVAMPLLFITGCAR